MENYCFERGQQLHLQHHQPQLLRHEANYGAMRSQFVSYDQARVMSCYSALYHSPVQQMDDFGPSHPHRIPYGHLSLTSQHHLHVQQQQHHQQQQQQIPSASSSSPQMYSDKSRQLPCKTFLSVGCCPYRDRCVYIHDPRIASVSSKSKSRKKNKEDPEHVVDSFYWPALPRSELNYSHPCKNNKSSPSSSSSASSTSRSSVFQVYVVPSSFSDSSGNTPQQNPPYSKYNDTDAMYSIWSYFVEICQRNSQLDTLRSQDPSYVASSSQDEIQDPPEAPLNRYTNGKRLSTFITLASNASLNELPLVSVDAMTGDDEDSLEGSDSYQFMEDCSGVYLHPIPSSSRLSSHSPIYSPHNNHHHHHHHNHDPYRISPVSVVNLSSCPAVAMTSAHSPPHLLSSSSSSHSHSHSSPPVKSRPRPLARVYYSMC